MGATSTTFNCLGKAETIGQAPVELAIDAIEETAEAILALGMAVGMVQAGMELLTTAEVGKIGAISVVGATTVQAGTEVLIDEVVGIAQAEAELLTDEVVGIEQTGAELLLVEVVGIGQAETELLEEVIEVIMGQAELTVVLLIEAEVIMGQAELTVVVATGHPAALEI